MKKFRLMCLATLVTCVGFQHIYSQEDLTSRIINSSFEYSAEGIAFTNGVTRVIEPYGWHYNHSFVTGTATGDQYSLGSNSQGVNNDAANRDGNLNYWFGGSCTLPEFVEFSQEIGTEGNYLSAGKYKVSCRMAITGDKISTQRLFANNVVQYYGVENDYESNLSSGESATYAGYAVSTGVGSLYDMEVTVVLDGNSPLKIGVRTGSTLKDGSTAASANPPSGWFKLDYFRLYKLVEESSDATLSDLKVNGTTITGFDPLVFDYSMVIAGGSSPLIEATPTKAGASVDITGNVVTVTAEDGITTKEYTIDFVGNYMFGWDYSLASGTPADAGWTASSEISWGLPTASVTERYRDNIYGYARAIQQYQPDVTFYYPVQLEEGKTYTFTGSWCWVYDDSSPTSIFGIYDAAKALVKSVESTSTANSGNDRKTVELTFAASSTGTYYFGWTSDAGRNIIWGLSLIETGNAIEVTFDARNGGAATSQYFVSGDKIIEPTEPTYNGWVFEGWYTDNGTFANAWDFENDVVDQPITLYAKWVNDIQSSIETPKVKELQILSVTNGVKIISTEAQSINIYAVTGQLVKQMDIAVGETTIPLSNGLYIVNGKKVVIK